MKRLMVFLVGLFIILNVLADSQENKDGTNYTDVPIVGAFGFDLGRVMDQATLKKSGSRYPREVNGNTTYVVIPSERFSTFQEYSITTTPVTKRIARIFAVVTGGGSMDINIAEFKEDLYTALRAKYGAFTDKLQYEFNGTYKAIIVDKTNPKRRITITTSKHTITIEYTDEEIFKSEKKPNTKAL